MTSPFDALRAALAHGRHDAQLLDARDFDLAPWDKADRDLEALLRSRDAVVEALDQAVNALDLATDALAADKLSDRAVLTAKLADATHKLCATVAAAVEGDGE